MAGSGTAHMRPDASPVLTVDQMVVEFPVGRKQVVHAVSGLNIDLLPGETLGILGESGCGKSSAGRAVMQEPPPTSGEVRLDRQALTGLKPRELRRARSKMQMIMQDPVSSLNPRRKVRDLVAEGLAIWGFEGDDKDAAVRETLVAVGLDPDVVWDRRAHELSGGQCQRVCIARALMMNPEVLICDEPVSALDVSVQAQILNLLEKTKEKFDFSMIFIAHDVSVVKNISDRVMVLYLGKTCEVLPSTGMETAALHPYTRTLIASIPGGEEIATPGDPVTGPVASDRPMSAAATELPSPLNPPSGCRFRTRCPLATDRCSAEEPQLRPVGEGHFIACHNVAV
ncbi:MULTISPECIES: ABC transporter ATP-binding protein [unclassified Nocardioides]|uniref:oligopeptide/dipeptide ABC transporter ATP-binding protein n=1 Tax=unclassified Nocardioides TaxID=2615069 RepID=UPI0006F56D04|nr:MULTISPECIES: ABC transporter ATP-binding protein [unclassified Nocardioides]KQY50976.1 peptide ABC transporter ATP-binding protein [Nocardioides sp. Root140]KQZ75527.1 peptide ABC transporter ATP-binding protein [Nocardioides sp. Root151]KRF14603.1 peptide ABC transporter ATP-binding protein [Nocardioides sp. Soil796]